MDGNRPRSTTAERGISSATALLTAPDRRTDRWWDRVAAIGAPLVDRTATSWVRVTFLWWHGGTDERLFVDVNGVTDHHAASLQALTRIDGNRSRDGRTWAERLPIAPVLDAETAAGRLPPARYLLVDSIDPGQRERDLCPDADFWSAVWNGLLPLADAIVPVPADRSQRIIAGQSYGGLAALYAVLAPPDRWGGAIAQSASLWWPDPALVRGRTRRPGAQGGLAGRHRAGGFPPGRARLFLEVGSREDAMIDLADTMHAALITADHDSHLRHFAGGHDAPCWRGGLIDGLLLLLGTSGFTDPETER